MRTYQLILVVGLLVAEIVVAISASGLLSVLARGASGAPPVGTPVALTATPLAPLPTDTAATVGSEEVAASEQIPPAPGPGGSPLPTPTLALPTVLPPPFVPPTPTRLPTAPAPTATPTAPPSTPAPEWDGETVVIARTAGRGLNLRSAPSTRATPLAAWPDGTLLTIVGAPTRTDGYTWYHVRDAPGRIGWVVADFVTPVRSAPASATPSPRRPG